MMRCCVFLFLLGFSFLTPAQSSREVAAWHDDVKDPSIQHRRFTHTQIMQILDGLNERLEVKEVGRSVEGRSIRMVTFGSGPISVLMWSQMHGNEATATMALMDLFHLIEDDELWAAKDDILSKLNVHCIPLLNPDGAERFARRNSQGIDINRDALRQQTPEGRILKRVRDSLDADWGFNLHDQNWYTSARGNPASISFLAPAYNYEKDVNAVRERSMQLIAQMNEAIQPFITDQVGRYGDGFEPRAFGDNFQKWGTSTILVETGGLANDRDKQELRKINFIALVEALKSIATGTYQNYSLSHYEAIPPNGGRLHELIIRNMKYREVWNLDFVTDVAFRHTEFDRSDHRAYYLEGFVSDQGDLRNASAYMEWDAKGYTVKPGKLADQTYSGIEEIGDWMSLWRQGITDLVIPDGFDPYSYELPFRIHETASTFSTSIEQDQNPSLLFYEADTLKFVLVNGRIHEIK